MFKKNVKFIVFLIGYISLLIGFFLNENSSGGALIDFRKHYDVMLSFDSDLKNSLLNYHTFDTDHSPLFITTMLVLFKIVNDEHLLRFIYLHIGMVIPFLFYLCLRKNFSNISSNKLFCFSYILLLSPYIRSLSIWPGSEIIALIFLLLSIFFYLRFLENIDNFYNPIINVLFLAISSYYKPTYCIFSLFFFIEFFKSYGFSKKIIFLIFQNLFLSLPAFYFLFNVNDYLFSFFKEESTIYTYNLSNATLIISSILFFHFLFFIFYLINSKKFLFKNLKIFDMIILLVLIIIFSNFFNFDVNQAGVGGGFFLKISNLIFFNNILFYLICYFSFLFIYSVIKLDYWKHLLIFLCLLFQSPYNLFYHEYYEPLLMICFFTLFNSLMSNDFFKNKLNITTLFMFYALFFAMNLFKNNYYFTNNIIN